MKLSRDRSHDPPGVGTLMYVGDDEPVRGELAIDLIDVIMGTVTLHAAFSQKGSPALKALLGIGGGLLLLRGVRRS